MRRAVLVLGAALALLGGLAAPSAVAAPPASTVSVGGSVGAPATYSVAQLEALPRVGLPVRWAGGTTATGVSVQDLLTRSGLLLPPGKNPLLRVAVTVAGDSGRLTLTLGELDAGFGARPAVLTELRTAGTAVPVLVVPGDRTGARTVVGVHSLTVAVVPATAPRVPGDGSVQVVDGARTTTLSAAALAALPRTSGSVGYLAAGVPERHTESGPTLAAVLAAAGVRTGPTTVVAAVATDGYTATVTPEEATAGGRVRGLSLVEDGVALTQPRLVVAGDVKGGRYVSGVSRLVVFTG